jgi:hypothetical protein
MTARPASGLLVSALIRRVQSEGGNATVLTRGDATAGAILSVIAERGVTLRVLERARAFDGAYHWTAAGPKSLDEPGALSDYIARRRHSDPDLWVVELDSADAERIAAELVDQK